MTLNGCDEPNNVFARGRMKEIGIGLGDEKTIDVRKRAAEDLAKDLQVSKEKRQKNKRGV